MKTFFLWLMLLAPIHAETGDKIIAAARKQIGVTVTYDPAYVSMAYPNGDLPKDRGVCTDVLIRALREGLSEDLQKLVNEDMQNHFSVYPKQWGLSRTDKNIDHRRVPNLRTYLERRGFELHVVQVGDFSGFFVGDIVTCTVPPQLPHVMIVSDRKTGDGRPMVIHNIGNGTQEEDSLAKFSITGHYRWKTPPNR